jgi:hypothetical protein
MAKRLEDLTTEEQATFRSEIGVSTESVLALLEGAAEDAGRIGSEYMPASVDFEEIILTEFGGTTPPENAIGLKNGVIALGDGVTAGGNPINARRITKTATVDFVGLAKSGAAKRVVAIPINADELVDGATIKVFGTVELRNKSIGSVTQLFTGLAWDSASTQLRDGAIGWQSLTLHPNAGTSENIRIDQTTLIFEGLIGTNTPGNVIVDTSDAISFGTQATYDDGIDPIYTNAANTWSLAGTEETPEGLATDLWVMLQIAASGGGNFSTAEMVVFCDLIVETTLP